MNQLQSQEQKTGRLPFLSVSPQDCAHVLQGVMGKSILIDDLKMPELGSSLSFQPSGSQLPIGPAMPELKEVLVTTGVPGLTPPTVLTLQRCDLRIYPF